jgi:hypothetical protein
MKQFLTYQRYDYVKMSRQQIYCGNNLYELGNRRIGTPYECLKKGVGKGLHSDLTGFNPNYQAIIADSTYCGTGTPPQGKQMGTPTSCLRKGVGIGKKLQHDRGGQQPLPSGQTPMLVVPGPGGWQSFLMRWWPVIVALLVGVIAAIFRATYATILLTMIAVLVAGWFVQSVMVR